MFIFGFTAFPGTEYYGSGPDEDAVLEPFQGFVVGIGDDAQSAFDTAIGYLPEYCRAVGVQFTNADLQRVRAGFATRPWATWDLTRLLEESPDEASALDIDVEAHFIVTIDVGNAEPGEHPELEWNDLEDNPELSDSPRD